MSNVDGLLFTVVKNLQKNFSVHDMIYIENIEGILEGGKQNGYHFKIYGSRRSGSQLCRKQILRINEGPMAICI